MGWTYFNVEPGAKTETLLRREFASNGPDFIQKMVIRPYRPRASGDPTHVAYAVVRYRSGDLGAWVILVDRSKRGEFGYKEMSETSAPYAYDFPVKWLDELPPPTPDSYAAEWRERVRQRAAGGDPRRETTQYASLRAE